MFGAALCRVALCRSRVVFRAPPPPLRVLPLVLCVPRPVLLCCVVVHCVWCCGAMCWRASVVLLRAMLRCVVCYLCCLVLSCVAVCCIVSFGVVRCGGAVCCLALCCLLCSVARCGVALRLPAQCCTALCFAVLSVLCCAVFIRLGATNELESSLENHGFDPFLSHLWSQIGPFSRPFQPLEGPKLLNMGSKWAHSTCLCTPNSPKVSLEKHVFDLFLIDFWSQNNPLSRHWVTLEGPKWLAMGSKWAHFTCLCTPNGLGSFFGRTHF